MAIVQYKAPWGVLHIGKGRFFYADEPVEVDDSDELLSKFQDLELVEGDDDPTDPDDDDGESEDPENPPDEGDEGDEPDDPEENEDPENGPQTFTASSLKKLNAAEQKAAIEDLDGNVEKTNNEEERIALILQLQEENQAEGE